MRVGKLTSEELKNLVLSKTSLHNAEVIQSAGIAEDCSAIRSNQTLLLTTDPITATGNNAGKLAILISSNDICVSGGKPICCLLTIIAPPDSTTDDIALFMNDANTTANELGIDIIGGHTEFSSSVNRMIVNCTMVGITDNVITTSGAMAGDSIVMTKFAGIEGTAIMACDYEDRLQSAGLTFVELNEAKNYINKISVMDDSLVAKDVVVHSMHDITEGGVYGAVSELCEASNLGAVIHKDKIPVSAVTKKICSILDINIMRLISSGSILIVTPNPHGVIESLAKKNIPATVIGEMRENKEVIAIGDGNEENLDITPDELLLINNK